MLQPLVFGLSPQLVLNNNNITEAASFVSQKPPHCAGVTREDLINNRQLCKHDPSPPLSVMLQGTNKRWTSSSSSGLQRAIIFNPCGGRRLPLTDDTWKRKLLFMEWRRRRNTDGGCVLMESSVQRCTVINTRRTLGVLALTTNSWTTPHRPKEWPYVLANRTEYRILLIRNALT